VILDSDQFADYLVKLSGSLNIKGYCKLLNINMIKNIIYPNVSFRVKYTLNGILLKFLLIPIGFHREGVSVISKSNKRKIIIKIIIKGQMKWREKNRFNVALLIE
jgi:hypothetical protein